MTYERTWFDDSRWPAAWNVSGETIPARAVVQVSGRRIAPDGTTIFEVIKPDGTGTIYAANGPVDVEANNPCRVTLAWPASVLATAAGVVGPVAGDWSMGPGGSGFASIGALVGGEAIVERIITEAGVTPAASWQITSWNSGYDQTPPFARIASGQVVYGFASSETRNQNLLATYDPNVVDLFTEYNFTISQSGLYEVSIWHQWGIYDRGGLSDFRAGIATSVEWSASANFIGVNQDIHHPFIASVVQDSGAPDIQQNFRTRLIPLTAGIQARIRTETDHVSTFQPDVIFFCYAQFGLKYLGAAYSEQSF